MNIKLNKIIELSSETESLLIQAEDALGKKVIFRPKKDPSNKLTANTYSETETGEIFYSPELNYSSDFGQSLIGHELLHIIYLHRDNIPYPKPKQNANAVERGVINRTATFIEDCFIQLELENLGYPKETRHIDKFNHLKRGIRRGASTDIVFNRIPISQRDQAVVWFAVQCFLEEDFLVGNNYKLMKDIIKKTIGRDAINEINQLASNFKVIIVESTSFVSKVKKAHKLWFDYFEIEYEY